MRFLWKARRVTNTDSAKKVIPPKKSLRFVFDWGEGAWAVCVCAGGAGGADSSGVGFSWGFGSLDSGFGLEPQPNSDTIVMRGVCEDEDLLVGDARQS